MTEYEIAHLEAIATLTHELVALRAALLGWPLHALADKTTDDLRAELAAEAARRASQLGVVEAT